MNVLRRLCAVMGFLAVARVAQALVMMPLEIEELSKRADLVVQGVVVSQTCQKDAAGRIYTEVELDVADVWKGNLSGKRLKVVLGGGAVDGQRTVVSGQTDYPNGEEVVGFYRLNSRGEAVTIGLAQGKFRIEKDERTGEKLANNPFHGLSRNSVSKSGLGETRGGERLTVEQLKLRVQGVTR